MAEVPQDTNQGTPGQRDPCVFSSFGNVGAPLMATLNLPGFTIGLPVWLFSTLNVANAPDASKISTLCQEHRNNIDPLTSSSIQNVSTPSAPSGESGTTSNQKSKKRRRRRNRKKN